MRENISLRGTAVSPEIPAGRWKELLLDGRTQELCWECAAQTRRLAGKEDREGFYHDFSQMLCTLLERCGVAAHCLLAEMKKEGAPPEPCADAESLEKSRKVDIPCGAGLPNLPDRGAAGGIGGGNGVPVHRGASAGSAQPR